jgi:predicted patatin/cPLA2 family phospholipase
MKLLSISGGSTKIAGLAGAAENLVNFKKYKPDVIVGTSAGSILSVAISLGLWNEIYDRVTTFTLDDIFNKKPVNDKGKISLSAKLRLVCGELSLGEQKKLVESISKIVTERRFNKYKRHDKYVPCYVGCVDYKTGKRIYKNTKECTYDEYLQYVLASTSIPYAVEPVEIDDMILFDGGTRDHIGSHWMMENIKGITENVSIFSRPQNMRDILNKDWNPKNIFDIFDRDQAIRVLEISKKDEKIERLIASDLNIKHTAVFIPWVLTDLYGTDPDTIKKLYKEGFKAVDKYC